MHFRYQNFTASRWVIFNHKIIEVIISRLTKSIITSDELSDSRATRK